MDPVIEVDISPLKKKFQHACRWILCGSILFESAKVFHNYFLIRYLNNQAYFGIIGSLFSMIYLTARIIDLGAANSTPPYFPPIQQKQAEFQKTPFLLFFSTKYTTSHYCSIHNTSCFYNKVSTHPSIPFYDTGAHCS